MPVITDPNQPYFKDGTWGWDGTIWRRLNLQFGYYDVYAQPISITNVPAGDYIMNFDTVPAGQIWIITGICGFCLQALPSGVYFRPFVGGAFTYVKKAHNTVAGEGVDWQGHLVLQQDDYVQIVFNNCLLNHDVRGGVVGYKMQITA